MRSMRTNGASKNRDLFCPTFSYKMEVIFLAYFLEVTYTYGMYTYGMYHMSHRVPATFKLVYGHLNSIVLTRNFAWVFPKHFANSGQKHFAKL